MVESSDFRGVTRLWIIEKDSGLPVLTLKFTKGAQVDSGLFGAFMVAIKSMMNDIQIGELNSFQTDTECLLLTGSQDVISVLALDKKCNPDNWYPILVKLQKLSENAYRDYRKQSSIIETDFFDQLTPIFNKIILENVQRMQETEKKPPVSNGERIREALKRL